jgi:hypothetical protein
MPKQAQSAPADAVAGALCLPKTGQQSAPADAVAGALCLPKTGPARPCPIKVAAGADNLDLHG